MVKAYGREESEAARFQQSNRFPIRTLVNTAKGMTITERLPSLQF